MRRTLSSVAVGPERPHLHQGVDVADLIKRIDMWGFDVFELGQVRPWGGRRGGQ